LERISVAMSGGVAREEWHAIDASESVSLLSSDPERGLTGEEARRRLREYGPNTLVMERRPSALKILPSNLETS